MKKKISLIAMIIAMTMLAANAQKPNLKVYNDSDDIFGCDYVVIPMVNFSPFQFHPTTVYALTTMVKANTDYTFTESQLRSIYGFLYVNYVGAKVNSESGSQLKVHIHKLYDNDPQGDCYGGEWELNYDDTYNSTTAVMYITDEQ